MTLLPVVERELRVAARERSTYRVRFLAASLPILFCAFSLWFVRAAFGGTPIPPRELFLFLTWIAFIFVVVAGFSLTCDAISQEKRDSTLGLLFLTDLKGYDVVLGKLAVAALRGIYALLATVPVLALPLMMGGTNYAELARTTLTLGLTLLFSMTIGLAVSSFARRSWSAFGFSAFLLFGFTCLLPAYSQIMRSFYRNPQFAHWIELPSPSYTMYMSFRTAIGIGGRGYETSLVLLLALAAAAVVLASFSTPRVWRDRPPTRIRARLFEMFRSFRFGGTEFRARFRRRLLDRNPILWLSRREYISSPGLILALFGGGALASWIGGRDWTHLFPPQSNIVLPMLAWFACAAAAHVLIAMRLAIIAAERFGEDRRSGALELILSTPISVKNVLAGHWMGLRRYFAGPVLLAFFFQALALSYLFTVEHEPEYIRNPGQVLFEIFQHLNGFPLNAYRWELHVITVVVLSLVPLLLLDWIALAWLSTWRVLRVKNQLFAPISALIILHLPPLLTFWFIAAFLDEYRLLPRHGFSAALTLFSLAASIFVIYQLACIAWSRWQIYKHFRSAATDRYQPKPKRRWWRSLIP